MCRPDNALIKCSIVDTLTPYLLLIVVESLVLLTLDQIASIRLFEFKSVLQTQYHNQRLLVKALTDTFIPECRPIPSIESGFDNVC